MTGERHVVKGGKKRRSCVHVIQASRGATKRIVSASENHKEPLTGGRPPMRCWQNFMKDQRKASSSPAAPRSYKITRWTCGP